MKGNLSRLAPALERELEAARDRHRRKRAEGAMQFLAAIVESSEDAIYGKNVDSLIVSWNPAAERLFGYSAEDIVGRSAALLFPKNRRDEMLDILAGVRRGDMVGVRETERLHKSGTDHSGFRHHFAGQGQRRRNHRRVGDYARHHPAKAGGVRAPAIDPALRHRVATSPHAVGLAAHLRDVQTRSR